MDDGCDDAMIRCAGTYLLVRVCQDAACCRRGPRPDCARCRVLDACSRSRAYFGLLARRLDVTVYFASLQYQWRTLYPLVLRVFAPTSVRTSAGQDFNPTVCHPVLKFLRTHTPVLYMHALEHALETGAVRRR